MKEKNTDVIIKKIACSRFSDVIIDDELLLELKNIDPNYFWGLMIKEAKRYKNETKIPKDNVVDIYNLQLIYWVFSDTKITDIKKRKFYDSLIHNEMVKKNENRFG